MFLGFNKSGSRVEDDSFFLEAISSYLFPQRELSIYEYFANLSNVAALIYAYMDSLNWAGFYLFDGKELILGPFQGEPACLKIQVGKGVCGAAAKERKTQIVPDVSKFPGHIACSSKSRSELVVPIEREGRLIGVIDLDSPLLNRFSAEDAILIGKVAKIIADSYYAAL